MGDGNFHNPEIVLGASILLVKQLCQLSLVEAQQQDLEVDFENLRRAEQQAKIQAILRPKRERIGVCLGHTRVLLYQLSRLKDDTAFQVWKEVIKPVLEYLGTQEFTNGKPKND